MFDLASPGWLLALGVVPLIRWLHRWRAPLTRAPVSAVFLWPADTSAQSGPERTPPDPAWRRRALAAALIRDHVELTVWIDDSLSMSTRDESDSRLADGLDKLRQAIADENAGRVTLRSLSDPAKSVPSGDARAFDADFWSGPAAPDPPIAALMQADSAHWLVSDGASDVVHEWSRNSPVSRTMSFGTTKPVVPIESAAPRPVETNPVGEGSSRLPYM